MQTPEFLSRLAELAKAAGSLLIFDEVITGFRIAFGGMAEKTGIRPDLVTYGKVMGGGLPVGAYGGRADLMDLVAPVGPVYQAGTLSANPIAMTAGIATLKKLKRDQPYAALERKTQELASALETRARELDFPLRVQNYSSIFWPLFGEIRTGDGVVRTPRETSPNHKQLYSQTFHSLLKRGIYLAPSSFEVSFLCLAHQSSHQEKFVEAISEAIREVRQQV